MVACVAIVPWLAIIAVSAFRPLLVPRYLLFTVPFWAIALATAGVEAAASNERRLIGAAGVGALAGIWLAPILSLPASAERGLLVATAAGYLADESRPTSAYFQVVRLGAIDSHASAS